MSSVALPAGDPAAGFVYAPREEFVGTGVLPPDEQAWQDSLLTALDADTEAVAQAEQETIIDRESEAAAVVLKVSALVPDWCSISDLEPVLLHVYGSGFRDSTQIWWHDHLETTVFVDEGHLTTWVCPWLFLVPDQILVGVQDAGVDGDRQLYFGLLP